MSEPRPVPAQEVLEGRAVEIELAEDDIVVDIIVIAKVVRAEDFGKGIAAITIGSEEQLDRISQIGMIRAAMLLAEGDDDED